jgi:hypothetical protein
VVVRQRVNRCAPLSEELPVYGAFQHEDRLARDTRRLTPRMSFCNIKQMSRDLGCREVADAFLARLDLYVPALGSLA